MNYLKVEWYLFEVSVHCIALPAPNGDDPSPDEALEEEDPARSATMEDTAMPPPPAPPVPVVCPRPLPLPTEVTADDEDAPRPDSADPEL